MDPIQQLLTIDDPMHRITQTSQKIREINDEIRVLGKIRSAAVIEAYEQRIHPRDIAAAGGFNMSRFRQILKESGYKPSFNWKHNSKATQFSAVSSSSLSDEPAE